MPVDPTGKDLKRFLVEDPGGPVVMLNLLKFDRDKQEGYREYARRIQPFLDEMGAKIVYVGDCSSLLVGPDTHDWDTVLLVRYPSRQAFSSMVADPDYQQITGLRTESLSEAVLQATVPWPDSPAPADL
jgi:uncharacterized protein (DUF1330 family)